MFPAHKVEALGPSESQKSHMAAFGYNPLIEYMLESKAMSQLNDFFCYLAVRLLYRVCAIEWAEIFHFYMCGGSVIQAQTLFLCFMSHHIV